MNFEMVIQDQQELKCTNLLKIFQNVRKCGRLWVPKRVQCEVGIFRKLSITLRC
jgi:hypothetical protein